MYASSIDKYARSLKLQALIKLNFFFAQMYEDKSLGIHSLEEIGFLISQYQKYTLTNVFEYDCISHSVSHLAKTAYLTIARIVFLLNV